jgi:hypothetical protein
MWSSFRVNRGLWTPLRPQLFTFYQWHPTHVPVTPHSQRCKSSKSSKSQKLRPLTKDDKTIIYTIGAGSEERFLAWALSNNTPLAPFTFILWRLYRFEQFVKNGKGSQSLIKIKGMKSAVSTRSTSRERQGKCCPLGSLLMLPPSPWKTFHQL